MLLVYCLQSVEYHWQRLAVHERKEKQLEVEVMKCEVEQDMRIMSRQEQRAEQDHGLVPAGGGRLTADSN